MSDFEREEEIVEDFEEEISEPGEETSAAEESKSEKFIRLGESRVNKAIKAIQALENLSNSSVYEYTEEQVNCMFDAIRATANETQKKFSKKSSRFTFG